MRDEFMIPLSIHICKRPAPAPLAVFCMSRAGAGLVVATNTKIIKNLQIAAPNRDTCKALRSGQTPTEAKAGLSPKSADASTQVQRHWPDGQPASKKR